MEDMKFTLDELQLLGLEKGQIVTFVTADLLRETKEEKVTLITDPLERIPI